MKKTTLLLAALSVILSLTLPSCNKSDTPDALVAVEWYPIELYIYIQDKDAKDLLNYDATYYVGNDFMLTYNGKTYRMETKGTEENPELIQKLSTLLRPQDVMMFSQIYYAGGTADKSISAQEFADGISANGKKALYIPEREDIIPYLKSNAQSGDLILLMGARDPSLGDFAENVKTEMTV